MRCSYHSWPWMMPITFINTSKRGPSPSSLTTWKVNLWRPRGSRPSWSGRTHRIQYTIRTTERSSKPPWIYLRSSKRKIEIRIGLHRWMIWAATLSLKIAACQVASMIRSRIKPKLRTTRVSPSNQTWNQNQVLHKRTWLSTISTNCRSQLTTNRITHTYFSKSTTL